MGLMLREFCRTSVDDMTAEAFVAMHEHAEGRVGWDDQRDLLQFQFQPAVWTWLLLQYPELACAVQQ